MRKTKEILRLHFDRKLGQRQIARSVNASQSTVHECLRRFAAAKLAWPLPTEMTEPALDAALYSSPPRPAEPTSGRPRPDFEQLRQELQDNKNTTLQLLWQEYRDTHPDGYSYSRFCYLYERWKDSQELVLRQQHKPGEKLFVDWAGSKIPVHDRESSAVQETSLFVAVLGASSYTYAEATASQELEAWIGAHVRAFEFFGGVPELIVPDNTKTGVTKPCRYDPDLNPTYHEMALHYGVGVLPARVRKPRDKAKVEVGVQVAQRWIVAALRHRRFFSLREVNQAIAPLLDKLNQRAFQKRSGSRASLFAELDQPALRALPQQRFELAEWSKATVNIDYHIQFDHCFYSVPHQFTRQTVEVRATATTIEIFHQGARVASHVRASKPNTAVTIAEHRPKAHQAHLEWPPSRIVRWAQAVGPFTAQAVETILTHYPHPEMGYRSCLGIIRLAERYSLVRMEAAAERALAIGAVRYKTIKSILRNSLDLHPPTGPEPERRPPHHDNIRGAEYFE